jgi:hypothetical protein
MARGQVISERAMFCSKIVIIVNKTDLLEP